MWFYSMWIDKIDKEPKEPKQAKTPFKALLFLMQQLDQQYFEQDIFLRFQPSVRKFSALVRNTIL